ncbi:MAG: DEAD/DEAH box helicase [Oscillospiraceae bacterium]|nr:DEAD/DEAH box helicase [Oscillospiraceae bacterium]MBR6617942.1 DEAD/DEAH box helicase [Oscillospiraceae bacterium]
MQLRDYQLAAITGVSQAWRAGYRRPCIVIPCGGGKSIITADMAKRVTDTHNQVLFLVHRKELCEQITDTFGSYGVDMDACSIMMVQTACRRLEKIHRPKLIITDENHHCLANSYKKIYQYFEDSYCVGVTATPVRLNGGGLGEINDKLIIGPSVRELIGRRCLADFDCYAPQVADLSGLKRKSTGDFDMTQAAEMLGKPAIYGDIIRHYRSLADGVKAICYCPTIPHSMEVAQRFREAGIPAAHIDSNTGKQERAQIIRDFRENRLQILCNVDLISEGFDVPDCGASILLRPTKSLTLYTQQSMRCMRYQPNKRAIIIDHVGNVHRFGLPDEERQWTLDPKPQKKQEKTVPVKQCTECFYTHPPAPVCPKCGFVYPKSEREIMEEKKEQELMKIESRVRMYQKPDECRSMKELCAMEKMRGYKHGWAFHQAKRLGIL